MLKTTVYLPEELDTRLEVVADRRGTSKAELIRRAVSKLLAEEPSPEPLDLPVLSSGRHRSLEELDDDMVASIRDRSQRR